MGQFIEFGSELGLAPVGLGARRPLRLEKGYLLSDPDFHWPEPWKLADSDIPEGFLWELHEIQFLSASIWTMSSSGKKSPSISLKTHKNGRRLGVLQEAHLPVPGIL